MPIQFIHRVHNKQYSVLTYILNRSEIETLTDIQIQPRLLLLFPDIIFIRVCFLQIPLF